jgi:hypothetical protein
LAEHPQAPYRGSYWVVPGSLLAGAYPGGHDEASTATRLASVLEAGITSVIDLMQEEEILEHEPGVHYLPYADRLEALGEARGQIIEIAGYAMEPGTTPSDQEMTLILDAVDAEIDGRNSPTLVHCADGHGRTGMVVGCYLARHGIAVGKDAVEKIRELRRSDPLLAEHKSPTAMIEERFILRWKEGQ